MTRKRTAEKAESLIIPTEEEEQINFVNWLEEKGFKFTAIPNSTYTPSWNQKRKNYAMGLRSGLPDLLVVLPKRGLVFIEMKRIKRSVISPEQQAWVDVLNEIPGVQAGICKGFEKAKQFLLNI